jgi:glutaminyl-peptide cyclotransferase
MKQDFRMSTQQLAPQKGCLSAFRRIQGPAFFVLVWLAASLHCHAAESGETPKFESQKAYAYLLKQCEIGPRHPGSPGHRQARDFLVSTLSQFGGKVITQPFPLKFGRPEKTVEAYNIIAHFLPEKRERILLCAHWDTRPWADKDPDPKYHDTPIPGANDGASGVAVLLEVARLLQIHPPSVGVDIVLFDGEDSGSEGTMNSWAQGSAYYARHLSRSEYPRFGILIDMIGDADLEIFQEANSRAYARPVVDKVWEIARDLGCTAFKPVAGSSIMDDHIPLLQAGIPCIDLIDIDYPHWHTMADTPDKCSAASLDQIGRVLLHVIYQVPDISD